MQQVFERLHGPLENFQELGSSYIMRRVPFLFAGTKCKSGGNGSTFLYHTSTLPCGENSRGEERGMLQSWSDNAQYNQWPEVGVIT